DRPVGAGAHGVLVIPLVGLGPHVDGTAAVHVVAVVFEHLGAGLGDVLDGVDGGDLAGLVTGVPVGADLGVLRGGLVDAGGGDAGYDQHQPARAGQDRGGERHVSQLPSPRAVCALSRLVRLDHGRWVGVHGGVFLSGGPGPGDAGRLWR